MELSGHKSKQSFIQFSSRNIEKPPKQGHFPHLSYSGSEMSAMGSESSYTSNDTQSYGVNKINHIGGGQNRPRSQMFLRPETHGQFMGQIPGYDKRRSRYFGSSSSSADSLGFANLSPQFLPQQDNLGQLPMKEEIKREVEVANKEYNDENASVSASSDNMSHTYTNYSSNYHTPYQGYNPHGQYPPSAPYTGHSNMKSYHQVPNPYVFHPQQMSSYNYSYPQTHLKSVEPSHVTNNCPPSGNDEQDVNTTESFLSSYYARNNKDGDADGSNELLSKSRRDTLKSNRYSSVPSSIISKESGSQHKRVSSLGLDFKPKEYHNYESDTESDTKNDTLGEMNNLNDKVKKMSLNHAARQISDYNRFLFEDSDGEENDEEAEKVEASNEDAQRKEERETTIDNSNIEQENDSNLNRNNSQSSAESYNSIGSENNFAVRSETSTPQQGAERTSSPKYHSEASPANHEKLRTHRKCSSEVVLGTYSQVPMYAIESTQSPPMQPYSMPPQPMYQPFMHPSMNPNFNPHGIPTPYGSQYMDPSMANSRHYETHRHSMIPNSMPLYENTAVYNKRHSLAVMPQKRPEPNLDKDTSKKIEKFVKLRQVIASGNKSKEYRLKWVKMLINATNHQLYTYINIKGDYIQKDQVMNSKAQFIKSSMTHLMKLIKESRSSSISDEIKAETFYLYACIMKHDYMKFGQNFNMEKDVDVSIEYLDKCLEIKEEFYKAKYKLGEVYEEVGDFEKAIIFYKEAAKYGYNRAIYKVAYMYQNSPAHRSLKFLKYYLNLSNVDLELVTLVDEDRIELEDVVGMAANELGKLYEGNYPPDLSSDDEFLKQIVELIPLNYSKSLSYYNKAAKLGFLLAQVRLGLVYEHGELNREIKPVKSIQWFTKAATSKLSYKRHPDAMLGLSRWYLNIQPGMSHQVRHPDPQKAMIWCDRAIKEFNFPDAYYFMGILAEMGINPSNPEEWFSRAFALGYEDPNSRPSHTEDIKSDDNSITSEQNNEQ